MSTPSFGQIQQQPQVNERQDYSYHHRHGSVGPALGALAVVMVLGAIAVMIGWLCSGRRLVNKKQYDFDGWVETKCSSCVDGHLSPPPPHSDRAAELPPEQGMSPH